MWPSWVLRRLPGVVAGASAWQENLAAACRDEAPRARLPHRSTPKRPRTETSRRRPPPRAASSSFPDSGLALKMSFSVAAGLRASMAATRTVQRLCCTSLGARGWRRRGKRARACTIPLGADGLPLTPHESSVPKNEKPHGKRQSEWSRGGHQEATWPLLIPRLDHPLSRAA